jgi:CubicO group peptidase (beta-lactamase class C family)
MADVQVADNGIDYPVSDAAALGVDEERLDELVARAARDVTDGPLPSCQLAVARHGQLVLSATLGDATPDSRYIVFSCSKALTASSMWLLIGEGLVDIDAPAATYVPEFGANGKEGVTVRHLLTHTGGFPHAPMGPPDWFTSAGRRERFARWNLRWEPAAATSTTRPPPTGCWPRSSRRSVGATTGTSSSNGWRRRSGWR